MKRSKIIGILVFLLIAAIFSIFKLYFENKGLKKKYSLFNKIPKNCNISDTGYQLVYMNPDSCNYIVIVKKESASSLFRNDTNVKTRDSNYIQFAEEIPTSVAIDMIKRYNEKFNSDFENTSAINFEHEEILKYLVLAKLTNNNLKYVRLYFGSHKDNFPEHIELQKKNSVIVSVADGNGKEYYLGTEQNNVIDYGGLCPPPKNIDRTVNGTDGIHEKGYLMLEAALRSSKNNNLRSSVGLQPVASPKN